MFKFTKSPRGYVVNTPASLSETGKRTRRYFATQDEARGACAELRARFLNHGAAAPMLPPGQSDLASRVFKLLAAEGQSAETILDATKSYIERSKADAKSVIFSEACEKFAAFKAKKNTPKHLADIRRLPQRFADVAGKLVSRVLFSELEAHLNGMPGPMRNLLLREMRAVLNYAVMKGWAKENVADRIDLAYVPPPLVRILTSQQISDLLYLTASTDPELCPMLCIELFAGIRPAEAEKIEWQNFDWDDNILTVPAAAAKTRKERHIEVHPVLRSWLDWHVARGGMTSGRIAPATGTPLRSRLRSLRKLAGIVPWPQDCLRHTFASAALASGWRQIGLLCLDLGHTSQDMLHKHYHRAVKPAEGKAIFAVNPPRAPEPGKAVHLRQAV